MGSILSFFFYVPALSVSLVTGLAFGTNITTRILPVLSLAMARLFPENDEVQHRSDLKRVWIVQLTGGVAQIGLVWLYRAATTFAPKASAFCTYFYITRMIYLQIFVRDYIGVFSET